MSAVPLRPEKRPREEDSSSSNTAKSLEQLELEMVAGLSMDPGVFHPETDRLCLKLKNKKLRFKVLCYAIEVIFENRLSLETLKNFLANFIRFVVFANPNDLSRVLIFLKNRVFYHERFNQNDFVDLGMTADHFSRCICESMECSNIRQLLEENNNEYGKVAKLARARTPQLYSEILTLSEVDETFNQMVSSDEKVKLMSSLMCNAEQIITNAYRTIGSCGIMAFYLQNFGAEAMQKIKFAGECRAVAVIIPDEEEDIDDD